MYVTKGHLPDVALRSLTHTVICIELLVSDFCKLQNKTVPDQINTPCNIKYMCVTSNIVGYSSLVYWGM